MPKTALAGVGDAAWSLSPSWAPAAPRSPTKPRPRGRWDRPATPDLRRSRLRPRSSDGAQQWAVMQRDNAALRSELAQLREHAQGLEAALAEDVAPLAAAAERLEQANAALEGEVAALREQLAERHLQRNFDALQRIPDLMAALPPPRRAAALEAMWGALTPAERRHSLRLPGGVDEQVAALERAAAAAAADAEAARQRLAELQARRELAANPRAEADARARVQFARDVLAALGGPEEPVGAGVPIEVLERRALRRLAARAELTRPAAELQQRISGLERELAAAAGRQRVVVRTVEAAGGAAVQALSGELERAREGRREAEALAARLYGALMMLPPVLAACGACGRPGAQAECECVLAARRAAEEAAAAEAEAAAKRAAAKRAPQTPGGRRRAGVLGQVTGLESVRRRAAASKHSMHSLLSRQQFKAIRPLSAEDTCALVAQLYAGKLAQDALDDRQGRVRRPLSVFVREWFVKRVGLRLVAMRDLQRLHNSVLEHQRASDRCRTFGLLVGSLQPDSAFGVDAAGDFFLFALQQLAVGGDASPEQVLEALGDNGAPPRLLTRKRVDAALEPLLAATHASPEVRARLHTALRPLRRAPMPIDAVLVPIMDAWYRQYEEQVAALETVAITHRVHGVLDFSRFAEAVRETELAEEEREVQQLYEQATDEQGAVIMDRFVDAVMALRRRQVLRRS